MSKTRRKDGRTNPGRAAQKAARIARRRKVEQYLIAGVSSQAEIARRLNVGAATISRDVKALRKEWAQDIPVEERQQILLEDLRKLTAAEELISPDCARRRRVHEIDPDTREATEFWEEVPPDERRRAIETRVRIIQQRSRMLGLEQIGLRGVVVDPRDLLLDFDAGSATDSDD